MHRYTQKTFNKTAFSTIEAEKSEVLALWDMLQRYMDVTQPLPDMPRLEPFRHRDPVTREYDEKIGRNPRYWRLGSGYLAGEGRGGAARETEKISVGKPPMQANPAAWQGKHGGVSGNSFGKCVANLNSGANRISAG